MPKPFLIELPLKPYLYKYLLKKLNCNDDSIKLTYTDPIGFGIVSSLLLKQKKNFNHFGKNENYTNFINEKCNKKVILDIQQYHLIRTGFVVTEDAIFYLNKFLDKLFRNEFFAFVNAQTLYYPHIIITCAIDDFFSIYKITEDDLPKQSFCKIYQRFKQEYSYLELV